MEIVLGGHVVSTGSEVRTSQCANKCGHVIRAQQDPLLS